MAQGLIGGILILGLSTDRRSKLFYQSAALAAMILLPIALHWAANRRLTICIVGLLMLLAASMALSMAVG